MKTNRKKESRLHKWTSFDVVVIILATLAGIITLYPMIYVFSCSLSDPRMVLAGKVVFFPVGFSTEAYEIVCANPLFWRTLLNSVGYVVIGCVFILFTTISVAYPLTRPNLKYRKLLTYYLLIPMYFSGGMIPAFIVVTKLGMYNSPLALILPSCYSIWYIILCRTFMASLPNDLIDSALIDGSDQINTLWRIVIPLSKPVLAVIMIYNIVGVWNSWFGASLYITKRELQPVQLYLRTALNTTSFVSKEAEQFLPVEQLMKLKDMEMSANQIKYAMIVLVTVPIIAVYPMFQKHFTKGIMLGSLKG